MEGLKKFDQWSPRCDNKIVKVLSKGQFTILKMAAVWPYLLKDQNRFRADPLDIEKNSYTKFRQNSSSCFGGDVLKVKIKVGYWRPYLSMNRNHFRANTTRPLGESIRQVSKPEDNWSCIAHLSAEDMLKSAVIEEKKFKHSPWAGADNPLGPIFDVNRKASSLWSFAVSLKRISSTSDFIHIFS